MKVKRQKLSATSRGSISAFLFAFSSFSLLACGNNGQAVEDNKFNEFQVVNKLKRLDKENLQEKANFKRVQNRLETIENKKEELDTNFLGRLQKASKALDQGEALLAEFQTNFEKVKQNSQAQRSTTTTGKRLKYKTYAEGVKQHQRLLEQKTLAQHELLQAKKLQKSLAELKKHFFKIKDSFEELEKLYVEISKGERLVDLALNNVMAAQKNNWSLWTETFLYLLTFKWL